LACGPGNGHDPVPGKEGEAARNAVLLLSCRPSDSEAYTGRLYDRLVSEFGKEAVVKDVDSIPLGTDFRSHLNLVMGQCQAVLAVVRAGWLDVRHENGTRRLESRDDFVRIELGAALARGVPPIPVLGTLLAWRGSCCEERAARTQLAWFAVATGGTGSPTLRQNAARRASSW
jgi:hypothetical protein